MEVGMGIIKVIETGASLPFRHLIKNNRHRPRHQNKHLQMIDKKNFWSSPYGHLPSPPAVTAEVVQEAENKLGVKLPQIFIELLQVQNGGYTNGFVFPTAHPTSWHEGCVPMDEVFGIDLNPETTGLNLMDSAYLSDEWGIPEKQVLFSGDGHWFLSLDYRAGDTPSVLWLDTEMEEEMELASSMEAFLNGLVPSDTFYEEN
jgi:hypothetical protein